SDGVLEDAESTPDLHVEALARAPRRVPEAPGCVSAAVGQRGQAHRKRSSANLDEALRCLAPQQDQPRELVPPELLHPADRAGCEKDGGRYANPVEDGLRRSKIIDIAIVERDRYGSVRQHPIFESVDELGHGQRNAMRLE